MCLPPFCHFFPLYFFPGSSLGHTFSSLWRICARTPDCNGQIIPAMGIWCRRLSVPADSATCWYCRLGDLGNVMAAHCRHWPSLCGSCLISRNLFVYFCAPPGPSRTACARFLVFARVCLTSWRSCFSVTTSASPPDTLCPRVYTVLTAWYSEFLHGAAMTPTGSHQLGSQVLLSGKRCPFWWLLGQSSGKSLCPAGTVEMCGGDGGGRGCRRIKTV